MEIKVNSKELLKRLKQSAKAVPEKTSIQALSDLLIETRKDVIVITSSDSEMWLSVKCPAIECEEGARFCVDAKVFLEQIKALGDKDLRIVADEESGVVKCDYDSGFFSIPYDSADDFPTGENVLGDITSIIMDSGMILKAIELTEFNTVDNTIYPIMNGIHFALSDGTMDVMSANNHGISIYTRRNIPFGGNLDFTIPKKPSLALASILSEDKLDVKIVSDGSLITISSSAFRMSAKLLCGNFPKCREVMPKDCPVKATIDKTMLLLALKRVMPMSDELSCLVKMHFSDNCLTLSADDKAYGKSAEETVSCDCDGELTIGFKGSDLSDMLKKIDDENVMIELTDSKRAGVFHSAILRTDEEHVLALSPSLIM